MGLAQAPWGIFHSNVKSGQSILLLPNFLCLRFLWIKLSFKIPKWSCALLDARGPFPLGPVSSVPQTFRQELGEGAGACGGGLTGSGR